MIQMRWGLFALVVLLPCVRAVVVPGADKFVADRYSFVSGRKVRHVPGRGSKMMRLSKSPLFLSKNEKLLEIEAALTVPQWFP
jgi:hypothetical protein